MKMIVWVALLATVGAFAFTATADAQGYYSQRARQDRDYRSMSAATQRAYGTTSRTTTYSTQSYSSSSKKYR
ncbi:MAG: hypothetical protein A4S14_10610 [Proteobacteria bacterium SG_bin9]|nr:MAG: hypothetical protein A4S14_10610 [Proteobacteria bacterium SG_bin9]